MRDKLIDILYNGFHVSPKDDLNGVVQKAADYLIAHGVTVQKWIPVSERLPEDDKRNHFYDDGKYCPMGNMSKKEYKPLTNADRIRSMTDTVANFILNYLKLTTPL